MEAGVWREEATVLRGPQARYPKIIKQAARSVHSLATWKQDRLDRPVPDKATVTIHDLRRTCITNWSRNITIQPVATPAGHTNYSTTMKFYATTTDDQLDRAREAAQSALQRPDSRQSDHGLTI
jgi:integrase